jgi:biopolymer transport protein ExbD
MGRRSPNGAQERARAKHPRGNGGGEELNLTTYMDIIVTLVLRMVFTVSLMADFSAADVALAIAAR